MYSLNDKCSKYFTYADLILCGETVLSTELDNRPLQDSSWLALSNLAKEILDPTYEEFGTVQLTYGFCSYKLSRTIKADIYPSLDQHSCMEVNSKGKIICSRGGAAVDFKISKMDSLEVARWVVRNLNYDRLYFYGKSAPIHVSHSENPNGSIVLMGRKSHSGRRVPQNIQPKKFIESTDINF